MSGHNAGVRQPYGSQNQPLQQDPINAYLLIAADAPPLTIDFSLVNPQVQWLQVVLWDDFHKTLVAGGLLLNNDGVAYCSDDLGRTWRQVWIKPVGTRQRADVNGGIVTYTRNASGIVTGSRIHLWTFEFDANYNYGEIIASDDGGLTWTTKLPEVQGRGFWKGTVDKDGYIYVGNYPKDVPGGINGAIGINQIYRSINNGETWVAFASVNDNHVHDVKYDWVNDRFVLVTGDTNWYVLTTPNAVPWVFTIRRTGTSYTSIELNIYGFIILGSDETEPNWVSENGLTCAYETRLVNINREIAGTSTWVWSMQWIGNMLVAGTSAEGWLYYTKDFLDWYRLAMFGARGIGGVKHIDHSDRYIFAALAGNCIAIIHKDGMFRSELSVQKETRSFFTNTNVVNNNLNSSAIIVNTLKWKKFLLETSLSVTLVPTRLRIDIEFSDDGTNWYRYMNDPFGLLQWEDTAMPALESLSGECVGRYMRISYQGAGCDAANYFTIALLKVTFMV